VRSSYEELARHAEAETLGYERYLLNLCERECQERCRRKIERLLRQSELPLEKTFATFDLKRLPTKVARQMQSLRAGDFVDRKENLLAFGKPGTWSLKYNMVWDDVLALGLFPAELKKREIAYYKKKLNNYGVPMDNRAAYTKPEWTIWAASMADSHAGFAAFVDPIWKLANETPDRVPFTDWYETTDAKNRGMYARSVLGGMWMPALRMRVERSK